MTVKIDDARAYRTFVNEQYKFNFIEMMEHPDARPVWSTLLNGLQYTDDAAEAVLLPTCCSALASISWLLADMRALSVQWETDMKNAVLTARDDSHLEYRRQTIMVHYGRFFDRTNRWLSHWNGVLNNRSLPKEPVTWN
jgi:hypothetical protein